MKNLHIATFLLLKLNKPWQWQMLTPSGERFQAILKEAPAEYQQYLVHVTKYQAAQHCKVGSKQQMIYWLFEVYQCVFTRSFMFSMFCNLDVDRRQVAVADGAEVGPSGHSFSPIRRPADLQLQEGLHLRKPRCDEIARWRWRARIMWGKPCSCYILNIVPSLPWLDSALIQTHVSFVFDRSISTQWKEELFTRAMRAVWSTVWKVGPTMRWARSMSIESIWCGNVPWSMD